MEFSLYFRTNEDSIILASTHFVIGTSQYESFRGKDSSAAGTGSFTWTSAVQGLALLFLRHKVYSGTRSGVLSGEARSLAASLDYALSKQPRWLIDMFGVRESGTPNFRYLLYRLNGGRKKPGPVEIAVRQGCDLKLNIFREKKLLLAKEDISSLIANLENKCEEIIVSTETPTIGSGRLPLDIEASCPYPGLRSFEEEDTEFFFGREKEREELFTMIHRWPCVVLFGSSGSGKSSLINAGLIPRLLNETSQEKVWDVKKIRPRKDPILAVREAYSFLESNEPYSSSVGESIPIDKFILQKGHRLLVIDQAEELFTSCSPEMCEAFLRLLAQAIQESPDFHVLFSLRSDFLGQLMDAQQGFAISSDVFSLSPMPADFLRFVIELPARLKGVRVESMLISKIIDELGGTVGQLPLTQFVLREIWYRQVDKQMPLSAYDEIGGVKGAIALHCENVFTGLSDKQGALFEDLIFDLVHIDAESGVATKALKTVSHDISTDFLSLIDSLVEGRILVRDEAPDKGMFSVELVHESLITAWNRITDIVVREREFILWRTQLAVRATQYFAADRDHELLLGRDALTKADNWVQLWRRLDKRLREYLSDSREFIQRREEKRKKEKARLLVETVSGASISGLVKVLDQMLEVKQECLELIKESLDRYQADLDVKLKLALLVLAEVGGDLPDILKGVISVLTPADVASLGTILGVQLRECESVLSSLALRSDDPLKVLKAAAVLAEISKPSKAFWADLSSHLVNQCSKITPSEVSPWIDSLFGVKGKLHGPLRRAIAENAPCSTLNAQTFLFLGLFKDRKEDIAFLCMRAVPSEIDNLVRLLKNARVSAEWLSQMIDQERTGLTEEEEFEATIRIVFIGLSLGYYELITCLPSGKRVTRTLASLLMLASQAGGLNICPLRVTESSSLGRQHKYILLSLASQYISQLSDHDAERLIQLYLAEGDSGLHAVLRLVLDRCGRSDQRESAEIDLVKKNGGLLIRENWLLVEAGKHLLEFVRIPEIEGLWLSSTPVTVSQFKAYRWSEDVGAFSQNSGGDDCPVVGVSWFDCEEYCKLLSQDKKRVGKFRLPFSREWLIAAQVNPSDEFWFGNTIEAFPFFGWYYANSERSTNPVRRLVPSPRGLFDLHGNVWEWCADIYTQDGINLSETKQKDAVVQGDSRILRGGSWSDSPNWCSLQTTSNPHWPADRGFMFGARIALELHIQSHD